jgi:hypothetical protein
LFYIAGDERLSAVAIKETADSLDVGAPQALFDVHVHSSEIGSYTVTPDGQRFLVNMQISDAAQPIVVVLNWEAGLKK